MPNHELRCARHARAARLRILVVITATTVLPGAVVIATPGAITEARTISAVLLAVGLAIGAATTLVYRRYLALLALRWWRGRGERHRPTATGEQQ
jgi:hypothetical protein